MNRQLLSALIIALTVTIAIVAFPLKTYAAAPTPIVVNDPSGDDKGPGYYGYPGDKVFKPSVYDILKFEVIPGDKYVTFKVYLKNLGDNPWNGPNGFCLQYVQIYVRTTQTGIPAREDTLGLNIALRSDYAWHFALLLAPGWGTDPVPKGQRAALYYSNGTIVVQNSKTFIVSADNKTNAIIAQVSKNLIPDLSNLDSWKIVVAVASYDGFGPMRVRVAGIKGGEWVLNATAYANKTEIAKVAKAIAAGIEPRVLDLAIYSPQYPKGITASEQYLWLNSFKPTLKTLATIPSLPPVTITTTKTTTLTQTSTTTATTTLTQTATKTLTKTQTQIRTQTMTKTTTLPPRTSTITQTQRLTTTQVSTTTVTKTKSVTNWTAAWIIGIVLFFVGLGVGFAIKRR